MRGPGKLNCGNAPGLRPQSDSEPAIGRNSWIGDPQQKLKRPADPVHQGVYVNGSSIIPSGTETMAAGNVIAGGVPEVNELAPRAPYVSAPFEK